MNENNRWKKFFHDVGVYGVGNVGAKVITFLMVPLYTYFIPDTAAFGYFDICLTAAFLLAPLLTLDMRDGLFRFLLNAPDQTEKSCVIKAASQVLIRMMGFAFVILIAVACFLPIDHKWLTLLLLLSVALIEVYGQTVRGLGHTKVFVGMGLATALLIAVLSIVLVAYMGMGIAGIFWANIGARLLPIVFVELRSRLVLKYYLYSAPWRQHARQLVRYTLPQIPTILIWWVLSFGDRWFVLWSSGAEANGVYAVAARFTGAIYTFTVILQQAWQETAILQYRSKDRDAFFSQIFTVFIYALCAVVIVYVAVLKLNYHWLVESHYAMSQQYLFPMAVAAGIFSIVNFLEMGYQCSLETHRAPLPSIITGCLNVVLNLLLAPLWGVWGVIAASLLTFTFFAIYRYLDTRRYFSLRPDWRTVIPVVMLAVAGVSSYLALPWWIYLLISAVALLVVVWSMPTSWRRLFSHSSVSGSGSEAVVDKL